MLFTKQANYLWLFGTLLKQILPPNVGIIIAVYCITSQSLFFLWGSCDKPTVILFIFYIFFC